MNSIFPITALFTGGQASMAEQLERGLTALPGPRFHLIQVAASEKVLDVLSSFQCDLLIFDLSSQDPSHRETLKRIRRTVPGLAVLAMVRGVDMSPLTDGLADECVPLEQAGNPLLGRLADLLVQKRRPADPALLRSNPHYNSPRTTARILIVDDDSDLRHLTNRILDRTGKFEVKEAPDGVTALEIAQEWHPDLILADVMMPRLNGFELCTALRRDPELRTIPIVLLTVRNSVADIVQGFELGATNYLVKPIQPDRLPDLILKALEAQGVELELLR